MAYINEQTDRFINAAGNGYEWETFPPGGGRARAINQGDLLPPATRGRYRRGTTAFDRTIDPPDFRRGSTRMNGDDYDGDIYRNLTERHHLKPQKRTDADGTPCGQQTRFSRTACTAPGTRGTAKGGEFHRNASGFVNTTIVHRTDADGTPCGSPTAGLTGTACAPYRTGKAKGGQMRNASGTNGQTFGPIFTRVPGRAKAGTMTGSARFSQPPRPWDRGSTRMNGDDYDGDIYRNLTERHHLKPQKRSSSGQFSRPPEDWPWGTKGGITSFDSIDTDFRRATGPGLQPVQAVAPQPPTPPPPPPPLSSFQQRMNSFGCNGLHSRRGVLQSKLNNLQSAGTNPQWVIQLQKKLMYIDNQLQIKGC